MRLLLSWVRDFVDIKASLDDVAGRIGLRGFEVAAVEPDGPSDGVIDFEVTANRPDCLSVLGFAREIATAYNLPLRPPSPEPGARVSIAAVPAGETDRLSVTIEDDERCPRYASAVAEVTSSSTPSWMKQRLEEIRFLEVTTSMLPYGVPFPVVPESTEIMNIIIPEMIQNALTESMSVQEAADDAAERINELINPA